MTLTRTVPSPLGELLLAGEGDVLTGLWFTGHEPAPRIGPATADATSDTGAFGDAVRQLDEFFTGRRTSFDLALDLRGTPFQLRVWEALARIPYGATVTYGDVAAEAGRPGAARAAGHAIARNPVSIVVPCHRVVGGGGRLTGYAGGLDRKRALLALERSSVAGAATRR
ncbi:MAG: methylated-DNA--[protein]-cysteine S-methyltransferase [Actinomycetota bacterium]